MADALKPRELSEELRAAVRALALAQKSPRPPWGDGRLADNKRFDANIETTVVHRLGRKPRGFIVIGSRLIDGAVDSNPCELVAKSMDSGKAIMVLVTAGTVGRIHDVWFW